MENEPTNIAGSSLVSAEPPKPAQNPPSLVFEERKMELQNSKSVWLSLFLVNIILLMCVAFFAFFEFIMNGQFTAVLLLELALSLPLIYSAIFFHAQHSRDREYLEEYSFKSVVARSLEAYRVLLKEDINPERAEERKKLLDFITDSVKNLHTPPRSIISKKHEKIDLIQNTTWIEKSKAAVTAFITTVFASFISGMKSGQTSALALRLSGTYRREQVLFMLPLVSLAFVTLSIFVFGSTGIIRSTLAYDLQEVMGNLYFSQTLLFAGSVAFSACLSACILILLAKPIGRFLSRINGKYLKIFGFCIGALIITHLTGIYGVMVAFTATCIGMLSSRLGIKSTHMMGVLLLPSIVTAIL